MYKLPPAPDGHKRRKLEQEKKFALKTHKLAKARGLLNASPEKDTERGRLRDKALVDKEEGHVLDQVVYL